MDAIGSLAVYAANSLSTTEETETSFGGNITRAPSCVHLSDHSIATTMTANANGKFASSALEALPVELILAIFEHLPIRDIPNLRLTSNVLAAVGIDPLVRYTYGIFTRESFEKLRNISKHSEMSKRVMNIHYQPVFMRKYSYGLYRLNFLNSRNTSSFRKRFDVVDPDSKDEIEAGIEER